MPQFKRRPLTAAMILMCAVPCMTQAQEADTSEHLPDIKVTAATDGYKADQASGPKFTQPLLDTTQTITVISSDLMRDQGAVTLQDALRNIPGITFQAGEGGGGLPGDQNFTMRGFSARNSILIDGVRDTGTYARDTFNLEQIDVARGPASTVAGRSTTGGFINQSSKTPQLSSFNRASIGAGTDDYMRATADLNRPVGDHMAARLNLMYHDAGVADRDVVENSRWGIAPSFAIGLDTPTRLTLSYMKIKQDNVPDYGLPFNVDIDGDGINDTNGGLTLLDNDNTRSNFYGLKNYDFEDIDTDVGTIQLEHDFSNWLALQSVLRYVNTERNSAITAPRPPNRQLQRREMGNEVLASNTSLTFAFDTGSLQHDLVTGIELSREKTDNRNSAQTANQPQITDPLNPNPNQAPLGPMPAITGNPSEATVDLISVYAFDTITISEAWRVNGGVRIDSYDVSYKLTNATTGNVITDLDHSEDTFTWQAGIAYKPRSNGSIYLGYSTSVDPSFDASGTGVLLSDDGTSANSTNLDPEESRNIELGTKWDLLDDRLALTAAIFRTEKTNARTRNAADVPFVLEGEQRVEGIELGLTGNITEAWQVFAGIARMRSRIEASAATGETGSDLALTPEKAYNLWTTYRLPIGLTVGGGVQYVDNVYRNATNTTEAPSYTLVDLIASYAFSEAITLRLNVNNVTDEAYIANVGGGHFIPGAGRSAFVTADLSF